MMSEAAVRPLASDVLLQSLTRLRLVLCWQLRQRNQRLVTSRTRVLSFGPLVGGVA